MPSAAVSEGSDVRAFTVTEATDLRLATIRLFLTKFVISDRLYICMSASAWLYARVEGFINQLIS